MQREKVVVFHDMEMNNLFWQHIRCLVAFVIPRLSSISRAAANLFVHENTNLIRERFIAKPYSDQTQQQMERVGN